jgi:predicted GNAT family acetyltransferase
MMAPCSPPARIVDVTDVELPAVRTFLEAHIETSLFLLSNLRAFGPRAGASPYSGDVRALVEAGEIRAVWCLTRGGHLLVQTGGRAETVAQIDRDVVASEATVRGVLGEWPGASAVWRELCDRHVVTPTQVSREVLYRLGLPPASMPAPPEAYRIRTLTAGDHAVWEPLALAFLREQHLPESPIPDRRSAFERSAAQGHWWGAWDADELVSIASFNAFYRSTAQVGGVFTCPERRRQGFSRAVMQVLIREGVTVHGLDRLILFTGEEAVAARALYESLGFEAIGAFGLFFGEPSGGGGAPDGADSRRTPAHGAGGALRAARARA